MNKDNFLIEEAYRKILKEQGPVAAALQGATQGVSPYIAGAKAGVKQLGNNVAGAIKGGDTAPENPIGVGLDAFDSAQAKQLLDNVLKFIGITQNNPNYKKYNSYLLNAIQQIQADQAGITLPKNYQPGKGGFTVDRFGTKLP